MLLTHSPTFGQARYVATSAFSVNSLRRRCCKPTAHCNQRYII